MEDSISMNRHNTIKSSSLSSLSLSSSSSSPYLFHFIRQKEWDQLRKILTSRKGRLYCQEKDSSNLTCIGLALAQSAPCDIISKIYELHPESIDVIDNFGATALHIGCLNGTPIENAEFIIKMRPDFVTWLDCDQRSPLHHTVDFICNDNEANIYTSIQILKYLCTLNTQVLHAQDKNGVTPIDLVQNMKMKEYKEHKDSERYQRLHKIYQFLHKTNVEIYRKQKLQWETEAQHLRIEYEAEPCLRLFASSSSLHGKDEYTLTSKSLASTNSSGGSAPIFSLGSGSNSFMMTLSALNESNADGEIT